MNMGYRKSENTGNSGFMAGNRGNDMYQFENVYLWGPYHP